MPPEFDATTASDSLRIILADDTSRARQSLRAVMNERDEARAERDALGECATRIARDRDQQVALYEAAMNWFTDGDEWERFEQSDLFRDATATSEDAATC